MKFPARELSYTRLSLVQQNKNEAFMSDTTFTQTFSTKLQSEFIQKGRGMRPTAPTPSMILGEHIESETKQISRVCGTLAPCCLSLLPACFTL